MCGRVGCCSRPCRGEPIEVKSRFHSAREPSVPPTSSVYWPGRPRKCCRTTLPIELAGHASHCSSTRHSQAQCGRSSITSSRRHAVGCPRAVRRMSCVCARCGIRHSGVRTCMPYRYGHVTCSMRMLCFVRCKPHVVRCILYPSCCILHAAPSMLCVVLHGVARDALGDEPPRRRGRVSERTRARARCVVPWRVVRLLSCFKCTLRGRCA